MDPLLTVRKAHYTDGQFRAYVETLAHGLNQKHRGRFLHVGQLKALLGVRARHVPFLLAQGDVVIRSDDSVYIDGWDEWQEGDLTVAARMAALRNRRRNGAASSTVTGDAA
ncbi:MAG TPA: hypothetical protein VK821_09780 [Dehalococcoidia bacterium]|nr:hypothetical protein [Dehalococcoidia bacterium]